MHYINFIKKKLLPAVLAFALALVSMGAYNPEIAEATGSTITWTGAAGDGSWHTAGNWDLAQVPVDGDCVIIPQDSVVEYLNGITSVTLNCGGNLTVSGGTLNLMGTSSLTGGMLEGSGGITISGNGSKLSWTGGAIQGSGSFTVEPGTELAIETGASVKLLGRSLINNGNVKIYNNGGTLELSGGNQGPGNFAMQGITQLKFAGSKNYIIDGNIDDLGNSASVTISDAGTTITFKGSYKSGTTSINSGTSATWGGSTLITIGALNNYGNAVFNSNLDLNSLYFQSGTIGGTGDITLKGTSSLGWRAGTIEGSGTLVIGSTGELEINSDGVKNLKRNLINNGTINISGQPPTIESYISFTNSGHLSISNTCNTDINIGNYYQTGTGIVSIDMGEAGDFRKLITNVVSLDGALNVNLVSDYTPSMEDTFQVMTYGSRSGVFATVTSNNENIAFDTTYNANNLVLTIADEVVDTPSEPTEGPYWQYRSPLPTMNYLWDVEYLNGNYMAVGNEGTLIRSLDGTAWEQIVVTDQADVDLWGITYSAGKYVIVGHPAGATEGRIYTSTDGEVWVKNNTTGSNWLYDVTYGNGKFVAVGQGGAIFVSSDGESWTAVDSGTDKGLDAIIYANNLFVAVGSGGTIMVSSDGEAWTSQTIDTYVTFWDITYGDGRFVAVGERGTSSFSCFSVNGASWTTGVSQSNCKFYAVEYDSINDQFLAVGYDSMDKALCYSVSDYGGYWTKQTKPEIKSGLPAMVYANGSSIAAGPDIYRVTTSAEGTEWTRLTKGTVTTLMGIDYGKLPAMSNPTFISVGGNGIIQTSTTGMDWTLQNSGTYEQLNAVKYLNGKLITVGKKGTLLTSDDASSWTKQTSGVTHDLCNVTYGNGRYVAVGGIYNSSGVILSSTDGISWNLDYTAYNQITAVTFANEVFIALGQNGQVLKSVDGTTWTAIGNLKTFGAAYPTNLIFADNKFIAAANDGLLYISDDNGSSWVEIDTGSDHYFRAIAYGGGNFVAVGDYGNIYLSFDKGATWEERPSALLSNFWGVVAGASDFVAVGDLGVTLQSQDFGSIEDPDVVAVAAATEALTFEDIKGSNISEDNITTDLNLIAAGENGTSITWSVVPEGWLNPTTGVVTRPSSSEGDKTVTLTATISKGSASAQRTFNLTIKAITVIVVPNPTIAIITAVDDVEIAYGTSEQDVLALLPEYTTIEDSNGQTYTVNLSWTIAGYDGSTSGNYTATGSFTLPAGVDQTDPETVLEVTATITVTEAIPSSNADLIGLTLSVGTLNQVFAPDITSYSTSVGNDIASITVTPVTADSTATVKINNATVASGQASQTISLDVGSNTITISVTAQDGTPKVYSITVYRKSSGGGGSTSSTPTVKALLTAGTHNKTLTVSIDKINGSAATTLDESALQTAFDNAEIRSDGVKIARIEMPKAQGVDTYILELPLTSLTSTNLSREIELVTAVGTITLPDNMLDGMGLNTDSVSISIGKADKVGAKPIVQLRLTARNKMIEWNNPDSFVKVSIPYVPTAEELKDHEHIVIVDANENMVSVPNGRYHPDTEMVTFTTTYFSQFAVANVRKTFEDINNVAWAKKKIEVLASKGILKGSSEKEYAPQTNITRADFLYFLVRTLGVNAEIEKNFDDIDEDAYYFEEIAIAKKLGISNGTGDNKFTPDANITRQDMMVLTEKALRQLKQLDQQIVAQELDKFADKGQISSYAMNSIASVVKEGLIVGNGDKVNPLGNTTRAEAAVFLYRVYNKY